MEPKLEAAYYIDLKSGSRNWEMWSIDHDLPVMEARYKYQVRIAPPGVSVRLVDPKGRVLFQHDGVDKPAKAE